VEGYITTLFKFHTPNLRNPVQLIDSCCSSFGLNSLGRCHCETSVLLSGLL